MNDRAYLLTQLSAYHPFNEQEERDREVLLNWLRLYEDAFERSNTVAHFTASAWIVSPDRSRVLMAYHNIYRSWAWLGGHADGETDLLQVALKEAREEAGVRDVRPLSSDILSLETLTVNGHVKRGLYVPSHLHLNVTYLLEADPEESLQIKADENSAVGWFTPTEALKRCSEPWMRENIYRKLNEKAGL